MAHNQTPDVDTARELLAAARLNGRSERMLAGRPGARDSGR
jgi:hypothetical protein